LYSNDTAPSSHHALTSMGNGRQKIKQSFGRGVVSNTHTQGKETVLPSPVRDGGRT